MKIRTLMVAAAAASLAAAPAVSAANGDRASAPVSSTSEMGGGDGIIGVLAVGVLAAFIALAVSNGNDDGDDAPVSA